ncbi:gamma-glutamyltransferase [Lindgomyces ingoldianus]|uniref:Gamma-glutamyltransferase n=1 Tax=Lindgomyces ingoldianus TaxID=673940 RepID=A0ACB6RAB1_9PLEO|nr:gamma-glutamyltransferase [Lindgomyces ingoldianus]KAF2476027.1 gamma-glutamyltransferase [Lindgomyces ingoldianus]
MFVSFAILVVLALQQLAGTTTTTHFPFHAQKGYGNSSSPVRGAVASLSSICSNIGLDLLKKGGNAADAMVGTEFCLGVNLLYLTGIGGGGFMLIRSASGEYEVVDFRETAPAGSTEDMFKDGSVHSIYGGLASGVPGTVRGLEYLHHNYGRLPWPDLLRPSIKLARTGFPVNEEMVSHMDRLDDTIFVDDSAWAIDFAPNGTRLGIGDTLTRRRYADLLEMLAERGPSAFYSGSIAAATISALSRTGGIMTLEDLANYTVTVRQPQQITYRDFRLVSTGAPTSGAVVLNVLKTLEGYHDIWDPAHLNLSTHRFDEAIRFGYGARTKLGDPSFNDTVNKFEAEMLTNQTSLAIRNKILDSSTQPVSAYNPDNIESLETPGTSNVVTADDSGLTVSLISTINLNFGSTIMVPETGLLMNNEMNDFSIAGTSDAFGFVPSPANLIRPGKRPFSSSTPVIVEFLSNSTLYFVTGASGGSRIITATLQSLWYVLDRRLNIYEALAEPRFHDQLNPDVISFDYDYDNSTVAYMKALGHNVSWMGHSSGMNALLRYPNGSFEAVGEPKFKGAGGVSL